MAMESKTSQMGTIIRVIIKMESLKDQESIVGKMDPFIKGNLLGDTEKVKEHG